MAKKSKKRGKITTEEALENLLGHKAAKRLRRVALDIATRDKKAKARKKR